MNASVGSSRQGGAFDARELSHSMKLILQQSKSMQALIGTSSIRHIVKTKGSCSRVCPARSPKTIATKSRVQERSSSKSQRWFYCESGLYLHWHINTQSHLYRKHSFWCWQKLVRKRKLNIGKCFQMSTWESLSHHSKHKLKKTASN